MVTEYGFILALLLAKAIAQSPNQNDEEPEPIFRAVGGELEIGYCFGVDYITMYKLSDGARQVLGNSSSSVLPPEAYRDRVSTTNHLSGLLGMRVGNLTLSDSGVYTRECWRNNTIVNNHKQYLYVCDMKVSSQEIALHPDGGVDLVCNNSYPGNSSRTIKWFREVNPGHKTSLFVDTKRSQEPIEEELKGVLQVRAEGSSLHISDVHLMEDNNFYCLLMEGEECRRFQNLHLPEIYEVNVFYSAGEKVVLSCVFDPRHFKERRKYWKTPIGQVNSTRPVEKNTLFGNEMYVLSSEESNDYSLVIPSITANHSGEYQCYSNLLLAEYFITVCTELVSNQIISSAGNNITLSCSSAKGNSIQWYRKRNFEKKEELIFDTGDPSVADPSDARSRMYISNSGASLTITELTEDDAGTFSCVVLPGDTYYDADSEYEDEEITETEDDTWINAEDPMEDECVLKHVTRLVMLSERTCCSHNFPVIIVVCSGILAIIAVVVLVIIIVKRKSCNSSRTEPPAEEKESLQCLRHSDLQKTDTVQC